MKKYLLGVILLGIIVCSCGDDEKEDIVNEVPKDGSIETSVKVEHLNDSTDILVTTHLVHKDPFTTKTFTAKDTIPALGNTKVPDENGNDKTIKKDYNIYITVK